MLRLIGFNEGFEGIGLYKMPEEVAEDFKYLMKGWEVLLELKLGKDNIITMGDDVWEIKSEIENIGLVYKLLTSDDPKFIQACKRLCNYFDIKEFYINEKNIHHYDNFDYLP